MFKYHASPFVVKWAESAKIVPDLQPTPPWKIQLQKLKIRLQHGSNYNAAYHAIQNHVFQLWKTADPIQRQQLILDLPTWLPYLTLDPETNNPQEQELLRDLTNFDPQDHPKLSEIRIQYAFKRPMVRLAAAIISQAHKDQAKTINITLADESPTQSDHFDYGPQVQEYKAKVAEHFPKQFPALVVEFEKPDQPTEYAMTIPLNLKHPLWIEFKFLKTCQPNRYLDNGKVNLPLKELPIQITPEKITIQLP